MTEALYLRDDGPPDGPPVVLLHSLFFDHSMFDDLIRRMPAHWRYLRPDHLGQARSSGHGDSDLGMDRLADAVAADIEQRVDSPVHLVGSSMGGYVALRIALNRPHLVASCTLLGASATAEPEPERFAALAAAIENDGPAALVDRIAWTMFGDDPIAAAPPSITHWRQRFAALPRDVAAAVRGVAARSDVSNRLDELTMPLLLICGEQDHAKPPHHMRAVADAVPGSRLIVLPGVGHTPAVENPDAVARELTAWVAAAPDHRSTAVHHQPEEIR